VEVEVVAYLHPQKEQVGQIQCLVTLQTLLNLLAVEVVEQALLRLKEV
jgi:hypothetical protein